MLRSPVLSLHRSKPRSPQRRERNAWILTSAKSADVRMTSSREFALRPRALRFQRKETQGLSTAQAGFSQACFAQDDSGTKSQRSHPKLANFWDGAYGARRPPGNLLSSLRDSRPSPFAYPGLASGAAFFRRFAAGVRARQVFRASGAGGCDRGLSVEIRGSRRARAKCMDPDVCKERRRQDDEFAGVCATAACIALPA